MHKQSSKARRARAPKGGDISAMPVPAERRNARGQVTSYAVWSPYISRDGQPWRQRLGAKTIEQLRVRWTEWWMDHAEGTTRSAASAGTLGEYGRWYLSDVLGTQVASGERSPNTLTNYQTAFEVHISHREYGCDWLRLGNRGKAEQRLNLENLEAWVRRMKRWRSRKTGQGLGIPTMTMAIKTLKAICKSMPANTSRSGVRVNPAKHLEYPAGATETTDGVLEYESDPQAWLDLINACQEVLPPHLAALWDVAVGLGLRRGEICGLQWGDFQVEAGYVHIRRQVVQVGRGASRQAMVKAPKAAKRKRTRTRVQVNATVEQALAAQRKAQLELRLASNAWGKADGDRTPGDWVFTEDGCFMLPTRLHYLFAQVRQAAGAEGMTLHKGRHDHASFCHAAGMAPDEISESMRHADPHTVYKHYLHKVRRPDQPSKLEDFFETARQLRATQRTEARA